MKITMLESVKATVNLINLGINALVTGLETCPNAEKTGPIVEGQKNWATFWVPSGVIWTKLSGHTG